MGLTRTKKTNISAMSQRLMDAEEQACAEAGKMAVAEHRKIVANWKHRVNFGYRVTRSGASVFVRVSAIGSEENVQIWTWADKGTKPSIHKGNMIFRLGYIPKTTRTSYGGPGTATGEWRRKRIIRHPGNKPRYYAEQVGKRVRPVLGKAIKIRFGAALLRGG
jgi:hypothetical protein